MKLRYYGNTYDPRRPDLFRSITLSFHETPTQAFQRHCDWLKDKVIGDPQPTEVYTVDQLKAMNMVGVYRTTIDDYAHAHPELIVDYPVFIGKPLGLEKPVF